MNNKRRPLILSIVYFLLGAALIAAARLAELDSVWLGMGGGLLTVSLIQLLSHLRYSTDAEYREKVDIESTDERIRFLRLRAWAWAGYAFILIAAALNILFLILGERELQAAASCSVGLLALLYWIAYLLLKRKH